MAEPGTAMYWIETWNGQISVGASAFVTFCGLMTLLSAGASCKFAGLLLIVAGLIVIAVEAPNFLPFVAFAQPAGLFFQGKPAWLKVAVYGAAAIIPLFAGCFKVFVILAFIAAAGVAAIHGMLFLQRPAGTQGDDLRYQGGSGAPDQAYSPTSP